MTYVMFHAVFTIPLLLLLSFLYGMKGGFSKIRPCLGMALLVFLAVVYTTPWDSFLIRKGIWGYSSARILGSFYHIPFEEYFFFVVQTVIGSMWTYLLLRRAIPVKSNSSRRESVVAILLIGWIVSFLWVGYPNPWRYLSLIVAWGFPILSIQWFVGYQTIMAYRTTGLLAIGTLTGYLWLADSYAIYRGIWSFSLEQSSGWYVAPYLPIEEALFFLVTTCMVTQGFILFTKMSFQKMQSYEPLAKSEI
jgi:lycopene cyclase domain-containing protein